MSNYDPLAEKAAWGWKKKEWKMGRYMVYLTITGRWSELSVRWNEPTDSVFHLYIITPFFTFGIVETFRK